MGHVHHLERDRFNRMSDEEFSAWFSDDCYRSPWRGKHEVRVEGLIAYWRRVVRAKLRRYRERKEGSRG